jgi:hypothetical protein
MELRVKTGLLMQRNTRRCFRADNFAIKTQWGVETQEK